MGRDKLTIGEARRLAISAQALALPRPAAPGRAHIRRQVRDLGLLQIDSVNVLVRAHYLPLFSRLGAYDPGLLEYEACHGGPAGKRAHHGVAPADEGNGRTTARARRSRGLFEYWGHEASLIPVERQPLFRWRMNDAANGIGIYSGLAKFGREKAKIIDAVLRHIADNGAVSASGIDIDARLEPGAAGWWGWSEAKTALEWLFWAGHISTAHRETAGFTRVYDLTERVLPKNIHEAATPERDEAQRELLRLSIRALGVATASDLRDYYRLPAEDTRARITELVDAGQLQPVTVQGWRQQAYLDPRVRVPRRIATCALLAPFDPLVWERARTERLFNFHYRLEIYTPAGKRRYGYYVLPFLLGDQLVARLCLKADRASGTLQVNSAHGEAEISTTEVASALASELRTMTRWLGLERVGVAARGDLAAPLKRELKA